MKKINLKVIALAAASMLAIAACGNGGQKPAQSSGKNAEESSTELVETTEAGEETKASDEEDGDEDVVYDTYAPGEEPKEEVEEDNEEEPETARMTEAVPQEEQNDGEEEQEPEAEEPEAADPNEGPSGKATKNKKNHSGNRVKPESTRGAEEPPQESASGH